MAKEIDIKLNTRYDGKGGEQAKKHLNGIADGCSKIGEALGGANSNLGRFMQNILKGGIWGAAAELVGFGIKKVQEWWSASEKAAKEATKAEAEYLKQAHEERMKSLAEYVSAVEESRDVVIEGSNRQTKALNDEIDATKKLTKATLELKRERARREGDTSGMAAIDDEMSELDARAEIKRIQNLLGSNSQQSDAAVKFLDSLRNGRSLAGENLREARRDMQQAMSDVDIYRDEDAFAAHDAAVSRYQEAEKEHEDYIKRIEKAKQAIEDLANARNSLEKNLTTAKTQLETIRLKNENDDADADRARLEADRKMAEQKKLAEVAAAQAAAKERDRLDRELHQKRMKDIQDEIAVANGSKLALTARVTSAQSEFDRAFAMYRDPSRAAAAIGEEKAYQNDLTRLHKDAARYGGKWRIDELSRLMAAGDSQGVSNTLSAWRKSGSFTPEIEAMVRASAAEKTKTTAEEELRKIESNTAGLAKKLEDLLAMKGGN